MACAPMVRTRVCLPHSFSVLPALKEGAVCRPHPGQLAQECPSPLNGRLWERGLGEQQHREPVTKQARDN